MRWVSFALAATSLLCAAVLPNLRGAVPVPAKSGAEHLRELEAEFMKATAERGSQGYMSYYAEDAVEVPDGEVPIKGKENIAKTMGFLDNKQNHLTWAPIGADISASEDLGYTYGTYEFRSTGKDSKAAIAHGKYTTIWKKQKDGSWKVVLDIGNNGPEPPVS